ncbi:MAG: hypothetical protein ACFBSF_22405, partial [Leptolyngbyaceae cyanobacterium]
FTKDSLVEWRQHYFFWGREIIPYFFAFLFSQTMATPSVKVGCHPLRRVPTVNMSIRSGWAGG